MAIPLRLFPLILMLTLSACANHLTQGLDDLEEASPSRERVGRWEHQIFAQKTPTQFFVEEESIVAESAGQLSMLRQPVALLPDRLDTLEFSWKSQYSMPQAHVGQARHDDAPARVVLLFEGDRSKLSTKDHLHSELSLMLTGEPLPYATLAYVWAEPTHKRETIISNARSDRIRNVVLDNAPGDGRTWRSHARNITTDYEKAFGEPPGKLYAVLLVSDTDNTRGQARSAWKNMRIRNGKGAVIQVLQ